VLTAEYEKQEENNSALLSVFYRRKLLCPLLSAREEMTHGYDDIRTKTGGAVAF
jgi:hypothetical protein